MEEKIAGLHVKSLELNNFLSFCWFNSHLSYNFDQSIAGFLIYITLFVKIFSIIIFLIKKLLKLIKKLQFYHFFERKFWLNRTGFLKMYKNGLFDLPIWHRKSSLLPFFFQTTNKNSKWLHKQECIQSIKICFPEKV